VVLTFDDGFRDVFLNAHPYLLKHGLPFAVFLSTGWIGRDPLMLTPADIRTMAAEGRGLITWGAHGVTHRPLTEVSPADAEQEVLRSNTRPRNDRRPHPPLLLPDGKYDGQIQALLAKHGFATACATGRTVNRGSAAPFALQRIPFEDEPLARFAFRLAGRT